MVKKTNTEEDYFKNLVLGDIQESIYDFFNIDFSKMSGMYIDLFYTNLYTFPINVKAPRKMNLGAFMLVKFDSIEKYY